MKMKTVVVTGGAAGHQIVYQLRDTADLHWSVTADLSGDAAVADLPRLRDGTFLKIKERIL